DRPEVRAGTVDTAWLDRLTAADDHVVARHGDVALVAAAIAAADDAARLEQERFFGTAARGRVQLGAGVGRETELRHGGHPSRVLVRTMADDLLVVRLGVHEVSVRSEQLTSTRSRLVVGDRVHTVVTSPSDDEAGDLLVE